MSPAVLDLPRFGEAEAERLRSDAHEMVAAYADTLIEEASQDAIAGIYGKGSAYKPWDSIIDYVPEISDVDIHVRFTTDSAAAAFTSSLDLALRVASRAMTRFRDAVHTPTHLPRPQLLTLNSLEALDGYLPSPTSTVHTVYGEPFKGGDPSSYIDVKTNDATRFLADATFVLKELPEKVIDRPGHHAWRAISLLTWRVSPAGPRLLTNLGVEPYDAWTINRTGVVRALTERGHGRVARAYADFYLACWDGAHSDFRADDAAERALNAVGRLYTQGSELLHGPDRIRQAMNKSVQ